MEKDSKESYNRGVFEGQVMQRLDDLVNRLNRFHEKHVELVTDIKDLDKRVSTLEKWRAWMAGGLAMAGAIGGFLGSVLSKIFL